MIVKRLVTFCPTQACGLAPIQHIGQHRTSRKPRLDQIERRCK